MIFKLNYYWYKWEHIVKVLIDYGDIYIENEFYWLKYLNN
jgi:hypothetical protein